MLEKNTHSLKEYRAFMILKNFSSRTVKTNYQLVHYFREYFERVFPDKEMCDDLVREYLLHRFEMKLEWQTVNFDYSSISKCFKNVLLLPWSFRKLLRPMKEKNSCIAYLSNFMSMSQTL